MKLFFIILGAILVAAGAIAGFNSFSKARDGMRDLEYSKVQLDQKSAEIFLLALRDAKTEEERLGARKKVEEIISDLKKYRYASNADRVANDLQKQLDLAIPEQ